MAAVYFYGKKWTLIKEKYFPSCSIDQIRLKFIALKKMQAECAMIIRQIMSGNTDVDMERVKYMYSTFSKMIQYLNNANGIMGSSDIMEAKILQQMDATVHMEEIVEKLKEILEKK